MEELNNLFGDTEQLWQYIMEYASKSGREATRIVLELYYVLKSPQTSPLDKTLIIAALGYQLLPDDKKLLSREKYGLIGFLDNGAALALAYNRLKTSVTPQIESQVEAIINHWFGSEDSVGSVSSECFKMPDNNDSEKNDWKYNVTTEHPKHTAPDKSHSSKQATGGYNDDEDVVID